MKYFVDDKEVDINTLKQVHDNLEIGPADNDYYDYEELVVDRITEDEIHFIVVTQSTF